MIYIESKALADNILGELKSFQRAIDDVVEYTERVNRAKADFARRNKPNNRVFAAIKHTLHEMCSGSRRCMYCEDSAADEVEHIKPKDYYPEETFVWENYLFACGVCNRCKSNKFAIFDSATGEEHEIIRRKGLPITPPPLGMSVLINPRLEHVADFIVLELRNTFAFKPYPLGDEHQKRRGEYTIETLNLNRDFLLKSRQNAYGSYKARLQEIVLLRQQKKEQSVLDHHISAIQRLDHPTVWYEMKRQRGYIPELHELFQKAPEALNW